MDSEYRESSAAVARGVIFLLRGQSCSAPFYLEKANRWFEEAQPHLETLDEVGGDQAAGLLFLLALAQAKLALYATAKQDDLRALRDSFEAEAQRTLSAVSQYRGLVFIGAYLGDEYKEFRERLGKKIDDESAIIAAGLKERDQSRIRTLLHMKTCS
jgi:hypothetical protein